METKKLNNQLLAALAGILKSVPLFTVRSVRQTPLTSGAAQADAMVRITTAKGKEKLLLVECKSNGQPRLVREAVNQLVRLRAEYPDSYGVVAAPYISPAAAELCKRDQVGYVDLAGNCRLSFDAVYVLKEGAKNPFVEKRDLRSMYSPRAARVLRVLLCGPRRAWKIQPLAQEASVSVGQVANVKKLLKDREWIQENDAGLYLKAPAELIREWSQNYTFRKNQVREFYCLTDLPVAEAELAAVCSRKKISYALTGLSGAARVQPGVRYTRATAYIGAIDREILDTVGLKEVPSGANVSLMLPYDAGVFYSAKTYEAIPVVAPVQLYLDLLNYKGRGEEAARTIYEKVIQLSWQ